MAIEIKKNVIITTISNYKGLEGEIQDIFFDSCIIQYFNNIKKDIFYKIFFKNPPEGFHNVAYFTEPEFQII
jgi:hypothetical protein